MNPDPYADGGPRPGDALLLPRHVARSIPEAASALSTSPEAVLRLLLRGDLAPAVLLPRWRPALARLAQVANEVAREPAEMTPALEDVTAASLLDAARAATPAPNADTSRAPTPAAAAHEAPDALPDPLYAVRVREWTRVGRELRVLLSSGQAVMWPLDRHPALARLPDAALEHLALWADASAVPTWVWGGDDAVSLVSILRDPACRLLRGGRSHAAPAEETP
jgi:hypothetical protein